MREPMAQVTVTINGKSYRMACDEGQESHLVNLANTFDGYVNRLKESFGEIGDQRLTIMAGVTVVDELHELQHKVRGLEADLQDLRQSRDRTLDAGVRLEGQVAVEPCRYRSDRRRDRRAGPQGLRPGKGGAGEG